MLVLTRKKGEAILIGNDICVTVLDFDGDKIKIGIDAPKDIKVFRQELVEETKNVNIEAAKHAKGLLEMLGKPSDTEKQ